MKKDSLRGWKDVFTFTVTQTVKSKSYRVSLIIMLVMILVSMPLMNTFLFSETQTGPEESAVEKVYFYNMTMYRNLDMTSELTEGYDHIVFENSNESMDVVQKRICEEEPEAVILYLAEDEACCYIQFLRAPEGDVTMLELQQLGQFVENAYMKAKIATLGVTDAQMEFLKTSVVASSSVVDTESAVILEDTSISDSEYWFVYGVLFVVLMVSVMASSQVATSIVQEKSSRVIEYLLTSIRPLALIVGKVLAMLVTVMLQLVIMLLGGFVSTKIGAAVSGTGTNAITQFLTPEILANLNIGNIILGLLTAGAGLILYATLAGLCGATASRLEEASDSLMLFTVTALIGAYIGMGAAGSLMGIGDNAFVTFALIFPLSSAFLLPGALLVGKADVWIAIIAIVVLLISVVLMFLFVAKVYESLILHTGSRIKMKEVFAMVKKNKKVKEAA